MPPMPMNAGGIHVRSAKNRMMSEASLRLRPMPSVANIPVGILGGSQPARQSRYPLEGDSREQTQEAGKENGKEVAVLSRGALLQGHRLDAVLFDADVQQFLVPFRVLVRVGLVDFAVLHCLQRP
jgi:hypothetical protein